jgi:hypothetical protein
VQDGQAYQYPQWGAHVMQLSTKALECASPSHLWYTASLTTRRSPRGSRARRRGR